MIKKHTTYLFLIFYLSPFIDSLSGYLILNDILSDSGGAFTPSQLLRATVILFSFYIIKKNKKLFLGNVIFLSYLLSIELIASLTHQLPYGFAIGITWASKLLYLSLIFSTLYYFYLKGGLRHINLVWHVRNNILISSFLLIIATSFSFGFSTYIEGTFGSKGFFASGNGLGVYLGTGLLVSVYFWTLRQSLASYLFSLIILISVLLIGTKSALIFAIIGLSLLIYLSGKSLVSFVFFIILISVFVFYKDILLEYFTVIYDVIIFRFENNDSLEGYVFSGRDVKLVRALSEYSIDGFYMIRVFTGMGAFLSFHDPSSHNIEFFTMESDFFEMFFMYGVIGLFSYLSIYLTMVFKGRNNKLLILIFSVWFFHSLFAGHSLFNGMSGILLPLILVMILSSTSSKKTPKEPSNYVE